VGRTQYFFKAVPKDPVTGGLQNIDFTAEYDGQTYKSTYSFFVHKQNEPFTYDEDGNMLADSLWSYTYNAADQLTQAISTFPDQTGKRVLIKFTYDYMGRRAAKQVYDADANGLATICRSKTVFVYEGWTLIAEYSADSTSSSSSPLILKRSFTWGPDLTGGADAGGIGGLLAIQDHSAMYAGTYNPSYDGNGNVTALVNADTGELAAAYEYDPYGNAVRINGTYAFENPIRFSSKYQDSETGLVYYGFRYYSPSMGRFINSDPLKEAGGLNIYAMTSNNPIGRWDYLGLDDNDDWYDDGNIVDLPPMVVTPDEADDIVQMDPMVVTATRDSYPSVTDYYSDFSMVDYMGDYMRAAMNDFLSLPRGINSGDFAKNLSLANLLPRNTQTARITLGSTLGDALRHIPLLGGMLGAVGDVLSGVGNVALAAITFGNYGSFGRGFGQILGGLSEIVGRIWSLPDTAVGLIFGAVGMLGGAKPSWDSNAGILRFTNMPKWLLPLTSAISFGSVNLFKSGNNPNQDNGLNLSGLGLIAGISGGREESLHTIQSRALGPFYIPLALLGNAISYLTPLEMCSSPWNPDMFHQNNFMEEGPMYGGIFTRPDSVNNALQAWFKENK